MASLDMAVTSMEQLQAVSRQHAVTDWYIIRGSQTYIDRWSMLMCALIVMTSVVQTCVLRRLFRHHIGGVDKVSNNVASDKSASALIKVSV